MRRLLMMLGLLYLSSTPSAFATPLQQDCSGVAITSPRASGDPVRGRVAISGSANIPAFQFYKLEYAPGDNPPDSAFRVIGDVVRTPLNSGQLAAWDTATVSDGAYTIKLTVVDIRGNFPCPPFIVRQVVVGNRAPTATPTGTPTETPTATPIGTPTRPAAPTIAVPTSAARITATVVTTGTVAPRPIISLDAINTEPFVNAFLWGGCMMGSLFALAGLFLFVRWVRDQI